MPHVPTGLRVTCTAAVLTSALLLPSHKVFASPAAVYPTAQFQHSLSADMLGLLDVVHADVSMQPAPITIQKDVDGCFSDVILRSSNVQLLFDTSGQTLTGLKETGSLTITAPATKGVSSGGTLTLSDLSLDLLTHQVSGTVTTASGVFQNVPLYTGSGFHLTDNSSWNNNFDGLHYSLVDLTVQIDQLALTPEAQSYIASGLNLLPLGSGALAGTVNDAGSLSFHVSAQVNSDLGNLSLVPEPCTWALMGLGLVGLSLARSRQSCGKSA